MKPPIGPALSPADIPPDQLPRVVNLAIGQNQILEMIATGAPLGETLNTLLLFLERDQPEMLCSLLLLDDDGVHLRHGAAPSLPVEYCRAIDGAAIGPRAGSCGTAAFRKERVVVEDTDVDPLWADYRGLARHHGLRACWSTPIFKDGHVIATFAMYFRTPGRPEPPHEQLIAIATHVAAIAIGRDIRDKAIRDSDERYRLVSLATKDAVWDWDVLRNTVWWNEGVQRLFGYSAEDVAGDLHWWIDRVHPDDRVRVHESLKKAAEGTATSWEEGYRFLRKNGTYAHVQDRGYVMRDESGVTVRLIGVMQDVTERRRAALEIEHLAFHEPVTQLPNRTVMQRELAAAVASAAAYGSQLSLLLLNLNHFRDINDSLGHGNGDILLQRVAQRLAETVGDAGRVASLGGDEFAVLLPRLTSAAEHDRTLAAVLDAVQRPFELAGIPIKLDATAGEAFYPADGKESQLIWQHADIALRTAKERRETYLRYHQDFDHFAAGRLSLIASLEAAIVANELTLHYQPKIGLRSGRAVGLEALIRWKHPSLGLVPPDQFMPLAERTDLINPLTSKMVATAIRDSLALAEQGYPLELAVNLSVRSLHDPAFCSDLLALVRQSGFPMASLTFEVTETAILSNLARARIGLALLRDAGIHLAMDDFGVGQSSLTYLKDLPMTKMKIDKSFVMDLDAVQNAAIVRSAIDLGRNLGLHVTAEGVEQETAFYALRAMGCDEGQGYLFSPPLPMNALLDWLRESRWRPVAHVIAATVRGRRLRTSLLIGLVSLVVYNANLRSISAGDTYPARYMPFGLLRHGSLSLDPILPLVRQGQMPAATYWIQAGRDGRAVSLYPAVLPVLVSPLYVPAALYLNSHGWPEDETDRAAQIMEKVTASLLAAVTSALLFLLLCRRASPRVAMLLALAFAFGTTTWMISSQALWQHGLANLLIVGALLLVTGRATPARVIGAGVMLGLIAGNRPPDTLLAAALGVHALYRAGRRVPWLIIAGAIPAGLVLAYNLAVTGHWAGGYGLAGKSSFFSPASGLVGIAGLLFSPTHGLFVFSPFLLAIPFAFRRVWADVEHRRLILAMSVAIGLQLVTYAMADWSGGASFGPRWLTDLLPFFFWMLAPIVMSLQRFGRVAFASACVVAIAFEAIGAFWYMNASDVAAATATATAADRRRARWDVQNAPFLLELRHAPAPTVLWGSRQDCGAATIEGNLDLLRPGTPGPPGMGVGALPARVDLRADGWALVGGHTPSDLIVTLDGREVGSTQRFFTRPDVVHAIRNISDAGWAVEMDTAGLPPGEHELKVLARSCPDSAPLVLLTRTIVTKELVRKAFTPAARAAELLEQDHAPEGYWLTSFTTSRRYKQPQVEMNTYLTSTLVDMLEPVAAEAALTDALRRARAHLTAQIEDEGLVRYHGLPNGPGIGTLGCAISPDADDTALVWRIAPGPTPERMHRALVTLRDYRTPEGLYRTWLAPRDRYQCLDPGRDPNPADLVIQMHVLMLLAQADPPAARALCAALGAVVDDDRVWVYYRMSPILPILRQTDLEKVGCALALPASRLRVSVPGQDDWVTAATLLRRFTGRGQAWPGSEETLSLLRTLAADDFSIVRANPPLLYHNDLTATTPRYYRSIDFGYALWLRLYFEHARRYPGGHGL